MRLDELLCCFAIADAARDHAKASGARPMQMTTDLLHGLGKLASSCNAAALHAIKFQAAQTTCRSNFRRGIEPNDESQAATTAALLSRTFEDLTRTIALVLQACATISSTKRNRHMLATESTRHISEVISAEHSRKEVLEGC